MNNYVEILKKHKEYGIEVGFISLLSLPIPKDLHENVFHCSNIFIQTYGFDMFEKSLLKNGTMWAFYVGNYDYRVTKNVYTKSDSLSLLEGFHRYYAFINLISKGLLPEDFQILVVKVPNLGYHRHEFFKELEQEVCRHKSISITNVKAAREINEPGYYWDSL